MADLTLMVRIPLRARVFLALGRRVMWCAAWLWSRAGVHVNWTIDVHAPGQPGCSCEGTKLAPLVVVDRDG